MKNCLLTDNIYVADLETGVAGNGVYVWASAISGLDDDCVTIFGSLDATDMYIRNLDQDMVIFYHNLKYDGEYWLHYLLSHGYKENFSGGLKDGEFSYYIAGSGQWYNIRIGYGSHTVELRDSLKLIPMSVSEIAEAFDVPEKKGVIDYTAHDNNNNPITNEEKEYIKNDVVIVKTALKWFREVVGFKSSGTIGGCALYEFFGSLKTIDRADREKFFPDLTKVKAPAYENAYSYIQKAYVGGWVYASPKYQGKVLRCKGVTADNNSLYPYCMHSMSGNLYPVGKPCFFTGKAPELKGDKYVFQRVKVSFELKEDKLPFLRRRGESKGDVMTSAKDLETVFTQTDLALLFECYTVTEIEYIDGCWFFAIKGLFDSYINRFYEIKQNSKGGKRQVAKLMMNNIAGKFAEHPNRTICRAVLKENGALRFDIHETEGRAGYIPIGAAITAYGRNITIRAALANIDRFCYSDTDSLHCKGKASDMNGIEIDAKELGKWKIESEWQGACFVGKKTYMEKIAGRWVPTCAGLGKRAKRNFMAAINGEGFAEDMTGDERLFVAQGVTPKDFAKGLFIPGNLVCRHVPGGVRLRASGFSLRER